MSIVRILFPRSQSIIGRSLAKPRLLCQRKMKAGRQATSVTDKEAVNASLRGFLVFSSSTAHRSHHYKPHLKKISPSSVYISLVSCLTISQAGHRPGANPVPRKKLRPRPHEARALSRELPFTAVRRQLTPTLTAEIFNRALTFANSAEQISPQRVEYDRGGVERTCSVTGQIAEHHMWVVGRFHHPTDSLFLVGHHHNHQLT